MMMPLTEKKQPAHATMTLHTSTQVGMELWRFCMIMAALRSQASRRCRAGLTVDYHELVLAEMGDVLPIYDWCLASEARAR